MIRTSYDNSVFSWVYKNYKSFLTVETYYILMTTENKIFFERLTQALTLYFAIAYKKEKS